MEYYVESKPRIIILLVFLYFLLILELNQTILFIKRFLIQFPTKILLEAKIDVRRMIYLTGIISHFNEVFEKKNYHSNSVEKIFLTKGKRQSLLRSA